MDFKAFSGIIGAVNTPLALAALSILVVGSILYATAKGVERPYVVKYGFGVSALFGILAIGGFFADGYFNQIFLAEGIVVADDGKVLDGAFVDMFESGQSVSSRDGRYKVPIFRKAARPSYNIRVQKPGYADWVANDVRGPYPPFQQVTLTPRTFAADNIAITADISVGIYIGAPETGINFSLDNKTTEPVVIQGLLLRLTAPDGMTFNLYGNQIGDYKSPLRPFTPTVVSPLQETPIQIVFFDWPVIQSAMAAADQSGLTGPYGCTADTAGTPDAMPGNLALEEMFDSNFRWSQGEWQARLNISLPKGTLSKSFTFKISAYDLAGFQAMKMAYKRCAGLFFANHYVSTGAMRSLAVLGIDNVK